MANKYITKLVSKREVANQTMAFDLEKPTDFSFEAGQNIDLFLINPPETDAEGNKRTFSIASSPDEDLITIATRMRDTAFKRVLAQLPIGAEIEMEGPFGDVVLHSNSEKPAVLLAGGIGITLFRSMIKDASARQLDTPILLFYSNRRPEDTPFLTELMEIKNPHYQFVGTMTNMSDSSEQWTGETGYINKEMLTKYIPDLLLPTYYIAGPPGMVSALKSMLLESGINRDNIRIEEFAGY